MNENAVSIAADGSGNTYVTGYTSSTDFPHPNSAFPNLFGGVDAFVVKMGDSNTISPPPIGDFTIDILDALDFRNGNDVSIATEIVSQVLLIWRESACGCRHRRRSAVAVAR